MRKLLLCTVAVLGVAASIFGGYYFYVKSDLQTTDRSENQVQQIERKESKATDTKWGKRWLADAWRDENGDVAADGLSNAVAQRDAYLAANDPPDGFGDRPFIPMNWLSKGPQNVGGRTRSLIVDPENPNIIWAGSVSGGVWRSTNGGNEWTAMNGGLQNFAVNCMLLDIDPSGDGIRTLWVGTGDNRSGDGLSGGGLFKSTNGGLSWTRMEETFRNKWQYIDSLAITRWVDPVTQQNETVMLAGVGSPLPTNRGIMRSTDGGLSWTRVYEAKTSLSIVVNPSSPGKIIAEVREPGTFPTYENLNRVIYSDHAGKINSWQTSTRTNNTSPNPTTDPPFQTDSDVRIVKLSYFKANPSIVYAHDGEPSGSLSQISKSTTGQCG